MDERDAFHGSRRYFEFRSEEDYDAVFAPCRPGQLRGEAPTAYLHSTATASNLPRRLANAPQAGGALLDRLTYAFASW